MSVFPRISFSLLGAALLAASNQAQVAPAAPPAHSHHVEHLDQFVVSAGHDAKTSFDVAQGTHVLAGEELHRLAQATLGETLATVPGVSSTYHGPGASRPVIRGLGGERVRVLEGGLGALDVSSLSPDHNTAIEPLFASRIEVLRGPSTLLYGSSAIGGVVNVIDNAIPAAKAEARLHGAAELRAGGAARERTGVVSLGSGAGPFATQLNALVRRTRDAAIPGVARIDEEAPARQTRGSLPSSGSDTLSGSLGGAYFWATGRAGAAISRIENDYGVPTGATPPTSIRLRRTRLDLEAESTRAFGAFRGANVKFGLADYTHSELSGSDIETTFNNKAWEGRLELPHAPLGGVTGMVGVQAAHSDFDVAGDEVVSPGSRTTSAALFALEEVKLGDRATLQFGGRYEGQVIKLGAVDPTLPRVPGYAARSGQKKKADGVSGSLGLVVTPAKDWAIAAALTRSERLPTAQELFSNGPHGATRAYEVGTSALGRERSTGFDASVRRRAGFVTGSIGGFVNHFRGFVFERELPAGAIPETRNEDGLTPYQFVATDADFRGGEIDLLLHLIETQHHRLHLGLSADSVRATEKKSNRPLPRIPPLRHGARLSYEDGRWHAVIEAQRAAPQGRLAPGETYTPGYTLLNASVSVLLPTRHARYEVFARGHNLTDAEARVHGSFLKEFAPLPGRGVLAGVRVSF
ncbi:MAG: TonB-dependent receptor [Opitutaceae bacterium]|nr:TonB-dependent receptor [Opitutaceae bacterium]